jgi:ribosomal-protein-alanine N-acetyltransferase
MPAEIRTARISDVDPLVALENAVFEGDRISRTSFRRLVASASALVLIADVRGLIAGYCALLFRAGGKVARLYSIAAAPPQAGHGIGRLLLDAAEETAAKKGCAFLRLEVREDNLRAQSLYEKSGFGQIGRKPGYYSDGAAALRYEKPLASGTAAEKRPRKPTTGTVLS